MIDTLLGTVAAVVGGTVDPADAAIEITGPVVTDSREAGPGSLFVARPGEHADGHEFAGDAAARGAVAALGTRPAGTLPTVLVPDGPTAGELPGLSRLPGLSGRAGAPGLPAVLGLTAADRALGLLARDVLARSRAAVVAITGSSGKTSTKDLVAAVLGTAGPTVAARESYNSEVGVPLTALRVTPDTAFVVLEMGARAGGQLRYLAAIAPPEVAVVLNVGSAHLGEFGSREAIAAAKAELVAGVRPGGLAVLNADDPAVAAMAARVPAGVGICWTGESERAEVRAVDVTVDGAARASFVLRTPAGSAPVALRLHGAHHVSNALAAAAVALRLGLGPADIAAALSAATPASRWRMEVTRRADGVTVVNDAYNANPESTRAALQALATMTRDAGSVAGGPARSFAVLGEMRELGTAATLEHDAIGRLAVRLDISRLVAVGDGARAIHLGALQEGSWGAESTWVPDREAARELLERELRPGDVVLVKSSRDAGLRRLGEQLAGSADPVAAPGGGR